MGPALNIENTLIKVNCHNVSIFTHSFYQFQNAPAAAVAEVLVGSHELAEEVHSCQRHAQD